MTPLHHAVNSNWKGKNFEIVKLLIERGADAKAIDDTHHTLHLASNKETAELLIDSGADECQDTVHGRDSLVCSGPQCCTRCLKELRCLPALDEAPDRQRARTQT